MHGSIHVLRQIDVGDSVELERLARILEKREPTRGTTVLRGPEVSPTAGVVLRREPLDVKLGRVEVGSFVTEARARVFEFGVVAFRFTFSPSEVSARALIELASRLAKESSSFDAKARSLWHELSREVREAVVPWEEDAAE